MARTTEFSTWAPLGLIACLACGADDVEGSGSGGSESTSTAESASTTASPGTTGITSTGTTPTTTTVTDGEATASGGDADSTASSSDPTCPTLVLDGSLLIYSVEDTVDLPLYTRVTEQVAIVSAEGVVDLEPLRCLREIDGELGILWNPDLESLAGLERLQTIGGQLKIYDNDELVSLEGLGVRSIAGPAIIQKNAALEVIGLRQLETCPHVLIGECGWDGMHQPTASQYALIDIDGLDSLRSFKWLVFAGNENLVSIDGLIGLAERTGQPTVDGPLLEVAFLVNPSLHVDDIHELWDEHMQDGPSLFTCSNLGEEEDCGRICIPGGP
jgi:hypothetical protein